MTSRRNFIKTTGLATAAALPLSSMADSKVASIPSTQLNNGLAMPRIGFGTNTLNGDTCVRCVSQAIDAGYRLFDTATIYGNEADVGKGIKQNGIPRSALFLTSKLWVDDAGFNSTLTAFDKTLNKLQTDYLDLYLIHRPRGDVKGTWQAMEMLYKQGKIKAIGVSNFNRDQIAALSKYAKVQPAINQIETHSFFQQPKARADLDKEKIQMQAWAPLADGRNGIFSHPVLAEIGKKYGKSNAQICLRWHFQREIIAIPRTRNKAHMQENLDIFDFELTQEDIRKITQLDLNRTQFPEWG